MRLQRPARPRRNEASDTARTTAAGRAARRWWRWSGNLLASGLVLIVGLTFGRQVLRWWNADDSSTQRPAPLDVDVDPAASDLQFGSLPFLFSDRRIRGDKNAALAELRRLARDALRSEALPAAPRVAETRLLEMTERSEPVESHGGDGRIYQIDGPVLIVVSVRATPASASRQNIAATQPRVVSWGLGVPDADSNWTLFHGLLAADGGASPDPLPDTALPAGSRRTMSLRSARGRQMTGFAGAGQLAEWQRQLNRWFDGQGWKVTLDWRGQGDTRFAQFAGPRGEAIQLQLALGPGDRITGLAIVSPPSTAAAEIGSE